jgi:hypothetical protein
MDASAIAVGTAKAHKDSVSVPGSGYGPVNA